MHAPRSELKDGLLVMLATAFALGSGAQALPSYSLSLFAGPIQAELGWSRSDIGLATTFLWAGFLITAPIAGRLADRFSVRRIAIPSILLFSMTFIAMSRIRGSVWSLYLGYGTLAALGAGTTSVCYSRIITLWFKRHRGFALGVMMAGASVAAMLIPILIDGVIRHFGWRNAWIALGLWSLSAAPIVWILLREPADAEVRPSASIAMQDARSSDGFSLHEAIRTRRFWFLALSNFCWAIPIGVLLSHLLPLLTDSGLSRTQAVQAASMLGIAGLIGRLGIGFLIDRVFAPVVAGIVLVAAAVGFVVLSKIPSAAVLGVGLMGFYIGSEGDLLSFFISRYFGRRAFSEILGWLFASMAIGVLIGPLVAGALYRKFSGYSEVLMICSGLLLVSAILQVSLGRFPKSAGKPIAQPCDPDRQPVTSTPDPNQIIE